MSLQKRAVGCRCSRDACKWVHAAARPKRSTACQRRQWFCCEPGTDSAIACDKVCREASETNVFADTRGHQFMTVLLITTSVWTAGAMDVAILYTTSVATLVAWSNSIVRDSLFK